ncbi:hypothetical protein OG357_17100 [Streptomyces sp. NBC_01255]|uniref:hypothetical protein n=1 Tax=Streptomyces sp. NBC_01255 TaxID=2903798 RepID=UPI002E34338D|nr:hypothetical protein [Streptomyces sp. NBC_01255]
MKIRQTCLAACAVVTLIAGTAACTSDSPKPVDRPARAAADTACANGTYTWFNVDKRDVLTGVAEKQKLGKGGGELTHKPAPLHTPRTTVTFEKGPRVGAAAALRSLGAHIADTDAVYGDGDAYEFANVRRSAPDLTAGGTRVDGAGTFVDYRWVRQVTADFLYTCADGKRAAGRATSWFIHGSGLLECAEPVRDAKEGDPILVAARMSCGPDAPAARAEKA